MRPKFLALEVIMNMKVLSVATQRSCKVSIRLYASTVTLLRECSHNLSIRCGAFNLLGEFCFRTIRYSSCCTHSSSRTLLNLKKKVI